MIFRNVSGGPLDLGSINAMGLADGATFDTETLDNGLPMAFGPSVQASTEIYAVISAGDLVVVRDGVDLDGTASLAAVTSSSVGDSDGAVWRMIPAQALAQDTDLVLLTVTLSADQGCPVTVKGEIEFKRDSATLGKSICVIDSVSFVAYHRSNGSKHAVRPSINAPTDETLRFTSDFSGNDARLLVRCPRDSGTISASLRVCSRVVTLS